LPTYRISKTVNLVRGIRAFLGIEMGATYGNTPEDIRRKQAQRLEAARRTIKETRGQLAQEVQRRREQEEKLEAARRKIRKTRRQLGRKERRLKEREVRISAIEGSNSTTGARSHKGSGALPDFVIIGAEKAGTTFLYWQLCQHPYVEPAAEKELHFFDSPKWSNRDVRWYRSQFPPPAWRDGQKVITGEASPYYLFHPTSPFRASETMPDVKLIALLRNPVDRAYSAYNHKVAAKWEPLSFEEALAEEEKRTAGELERMLSDDSYYGRNIRVHAYRSRGIYVDQLQRWHEHFPRDQLLVLKSEDLFADPIETVETVHEFLDLPKSELEATILTTKRNRRTRRPMAPTTRQRLEQFFEPHNQRLYEYLGVDFDW
jgi:Sulfotransferase domain